jgi:hypothetical protein
MRIKLTASREKQRSHPDLRGSICPAVLRLSSDPLAVREFEKIRISLTRQISHYGWRQIALGLQAVCEHGAAHQRANPGAAALWRWRAQMLRELAGDQVPSPESPESPESKVQSPKSKVGCRAGAGVAARLTLDPRPPTLDPHPA